MKVSRSLVIFLAFLFFSAAVGGAQETGEIIGRVADDEGVALPGVTVSATGPSLQGRRTALSSADGSFRLSLLPIGTYRLTFELQGFATVVQENVRAQLGMTTAVDATMRVATLQEQVTVIAQTPLIDKTKADTSFNMNSEELAKVPIQGRTIQEVFNYTPGVTGVRHNTNWGTGAGGTDWGPGSFRGEGASGNNFLVDGLSKRGADDNSSGVRVNYDAWDEVQVVSDGYSPELGSTYGGIINIVTKSGGNSFHGELGSLIWDHNLRASRQEQLAIAIEPVKSQYNVFGNIGGPIVRDRLWFFVSNNLWRTVEDMEAGSIGWLAIPPGSRRVNTNNIFGKLTYSLFQNHTFSFSGTYDSFLNQSGGFGLPKLYVKENYKDYAYRANYKGIFGANTLLEAAIGRSSRDRSSEPLSGNMADPAISYADIAQTTNNVFSKDSSLDQRTDFTSRFTQYVNTERFGNHELGLGFQYYYMYRSVALDYTGDDWDLWPGNFWDGGANLDYLEPNVPYQMREFRNQFYYNKGRGIGLYLKDKISFGRFTLMLGLRSETQKLYDDQDEVIFNWGLDKFISPRFSLAWDITGDGVNVFKLGLGQFTDTMLFDLLGFFTKGGGTTFVVYNWIGPVPTPVTDEATLRNTAYWEYSWQQGGPEAYATYPPVREGTKPDRMTKFVLEFDRRLGGDWALKARGVFSRRVNMIEDLGFFDYDTFWYELMNWEEKRRNYWGFEFELNGRISDKFFLNASYVRSASKGSTAGDYETYGNYAGTVYNTVGCFGDHFSGPADSPWAFFAEATAGMGGFDYGDEGWYGYLPYSCDNVVKVLGTYLAPYDFVISANFEMYSGYHWSIWGFQPGYGVYLTFPHGRGTEKVPAHAYADVSVEKNFVLTAGLTLGLRVNVNNLLNSQRPVSYGSGEGTPLFRQVWGRQYPRWVQFQVNLRF
jgi:hypothetical protein